MVETSATLSKKILDLLEKGLADENSLTESDRKFLRARAGYIKQKHQDRLPSVFGRAVKKEEPKVEVKEEKRRGRPSKEQRNAEANKAPQVPPPANDNPFTDDDDGEDENVNDKAEG